MKKLLLILLLPIVSLYSQNITGSGTSGSPYVLYNTADFDSIRYLGYDKFYKLNNDLDFSGWGPFTRFRGGFSGQLDMNHRSISNLDWSGTWNGTGNDTIGLFSSIVSGNPYVAPRIKNGKFIDCSATVTGTANTGATFNAVGFLAGAIASGTATVSPALDSLIFTGLTVNVTNGDRINNAAVGGVVGRSGLTVTYVFGIGFHKIYVEADVTFETDDSRRIQDLEGMGGILGFHISSGMVTIEQCAFKGSVILIPKDGTFNNALGIAVGGILGKPQENTSTNDSLINSYVRATQLISPEYQVGGLIGRLAGGHEYHVLNCYTQVDTLIAWIAGNDRDGLYFGTIEDDGAYTGLYADTQNVALDTLDDGSRDHSIVGYAETADPGGELTTAQATTEGSYSGWDFTDVWAIDSRNDGYPYLKWYPLGTPVMITLLEPTGGEIYTWPDTINIQWTQNASTDTLPYTLWYSLNNGLSWTFLDSAIVDTFYNWIIPNANTNEALIMVMDRDSIGPDQSTAFSILPGPEINILYPENTLRTIVIGDTTQILIQSANIDSLLLYFSQDSTQTWTFISGVSVDTTNGFFYDTTLYVWTMSSLTAGDIYIRAVTQADTAIYFGEEDVTVSEIGFSLLIPPIYCTFNGEILTPLEWQIWEDPSCGWASPPYTARAGLINEDGTGYDIVTAPDPCTGTCDEVGEWSSRTPVWLVSGSDTTAYTMNEFYTNIDNDTLIYKNRRYWYNPSDSSLYMDDLINNIDSMKIADLSSKFGSYWSSGPAYMQVYNVQYTKISGDTLSASLDFETLNDPLFAPIIVITGFGGTWNVARNITVSLLSEPNNQAYAEDVVLAYENPTIQRFYFRGIHPKAEKR